MADIGVATTEKIIENLQVKVKENKIKEVAVCRQLLIDSIKEQMRVHDDAYDFENKKSVVMLIGVNGVGKTTSVGKLASQFKADGKKVILAAADTFRAAAIEQLTEWSNRAGVELIAGQEGGDRRQSCLMQLMRQRQEMLIYLYVTLQDDSTIRKILWRS